MSALLVVLLAAATVNEALGNVAASVAVLVLGVILRAVSSGREGDVARFMVGAEVIVGAILAGAAFYSGATQTFVIDRRTPRLGSYACGRTHRVGDATNPA